MTAIFADDAKGAFLGGLGLIGLALVLLAWLLVVMAPTWIAIIRGHPSWLSIAIIDFFFSWTIIGWIACLAWSFAGVPDDRRRRYD